MAYRYSLRHARVDLSALAAVFVTLYAIRGRLHERRQVLVTPNSEPLSPNNVQCTMQAVHCNQFQEESRLQTFISSRQQRNDYDYIDSAGYRSLTDFDSNEVYHMICPSNFRDMAQVVFEWPWGVFAGDTKPSWRAETALRCARGVIILYSKVDTIMIDPLYAFLQNVSTPFILVSGQGGALVTAEMVQRFESGTKLFHWFGQNGELQHRAFTQIPAGINCFEHGEALSIARKSLNFTHTPKNLILVNFGLESHKERPAIYEHFCANSTENAWATCTSHGGSVTSDGLGQTKLLRFYEELKDFKFLVCPRGLGMDTHRTYEAMYLGVVPVVKRDKLTPLHSKFPILVVDSYDQVSQSLLEDSWPALRHRLRSVAELKREYWLAEIENMRQTVMETTKQFGRGQQCL